MKKAEKQKLEMPKKAEQRRKVRIRQLPTGVRGLDDILGGGLPELSFNIIAGAPGCGKTTLAHQIVFANATLQKTALYFTVLGEPALKMLRYQQQYAFFDPAKLNTSIRFINLSEVVVEKSLGGVLDEISREVEASSPSLPRRGGFATGRILLPLAFGSGAASLIKPTRSGRPLVSRA